MINNRNKKIAAVIAAIIGGAIIAKAATTKPRTTGGGSGSGGGGRNPIYDQLTDLSRTQNATRGILQNNPLNLKKSNRAYEGKTTSADNIHEGFTHFEFGLAAAMQHIVLRYIKGGLGMGNLNTIQKIIRVWQSGFLTASSETEPYIAFVVGRTGIAATTVINASDKETLKKLLYAMTLYECGARWQNSILAPNLFDDYFERAFILNTNKL